MERSAMTENENSYPITVNLVVLGQDFTNLCVQFILFFIGAASVPIGVKIDQDDSTGSFRFSWEHPKMCREN
jgi:hypothetical protein